MTRQPLRLTQPGEPPAPLLDELSASVVTRSRRRPRRARTPYRPGDSAISLHALASLIAQVQQMISQAVSPARDQGHTWAEIGRLLNLSGSLGHQGGQEFR